jgi:hypothetical protein
LVLRRYRIDGKRSPRVSIPVARDDSLPGWANAMKFLEYETCRAGVPKRSEDWSDAGAVGGVLSEMWRLETLEGGARYQMGSQIARIETIFTFRATLEP